MTNLRLLSWNVNGLRAALKKGFIDWMIKDSPDVLCLQETKVAEDQLPEQVKSLPGYHSYFAFGPRKGRDGVALFSKIPSLAVKSSLELPGLEDESRAIVADFGHFLLYNVYFPNGKASAERLAYKLHFYDLFLEHIEQLCSQGKRIVVCGDLNTAHKEIDLARPRPMRRYPDFCRKRGPGWTAWWRKALWTPSASFIQSRKTTPGGI